MMTKAVTLPSLKSCLLIEIFSRQVEDHLQDFLRSAEIKAADMTSVPLVKPFLQKQKCSSSSIYHTLFSLFLSRTVLTVDESQSCQISSTTESYFKMNYVILQYINVTLTRG